MNTGKISKPILEGSKSVVRAAIKNKPEVLAGLAALSGGIAAWQLISATVKATRTVDKLAEEKGRLLTKTEIIKATWKYYIPAAAAIGTTVGAGAASHIEMGKRITGLATAYAASETQQVIRKKVEKDILGDEKVQEINDGVAKEYVETQIHDAPYTTIAPGKQRFYEPITGQPFTSDIETVRKAVNDLNYKMINETPSYVEFDELLYEFGIKAAVGEMLGWDFNDGPVEITFDSTLKNGIPHILLEYNRAPEYLY